jgi:hypothetical protein
MPLLEAPGGDPGTALEAGPDGDPGRSVNEWEKRW